MEWDRIYVLDWHLSFRKVEKLLRSVLGMPEDAVREI